MSAVAAAHSRPSLAPQIVPLAAHGQSRAPDRDAEAGSAVGVAAAAAVAGGARNGDDDRDRRATPRPRRVGPRDDLDAATGGDVSYSDLVFVDDDAPPEGSGHADDELPAEARPGPTAGAHRMELKSVFYYKKHGATVTPVRGTLLLDRGTLSFRGRGSGGGRGGGLWRLSEISVKKFRGRIHRGFKLVEEGREGKTTEHAFTRVKRRSWELLRRAVEEAHVSELPAGASTEPGEAVDGLAGAEARGGTATDGVAAANWFADGDDDSPSEGDDSDDELLHLLATSNLKCRSPNTDLNQENTEGTESPRQATSSESRPVASPPEHQEVRQTTSLGSAAAGDDAAVSVEGAKGAKGNGPPLLGTSDRPRFMPPLPTTGGEAWALRVKRESRQRLSLPLRTEAFPPTRRSYSTGSFKFSYGDFEIEGVGLDASLFEAWRIPALRRIQTTQENDDDDDSLHLSESEEDEFLFSSEHYSSSSSESEEDLLSSSERFSCWSTGSRRRHAVSLERQELSNEFSNELRCLEMATKGQDWLRSFKNLDPRYQILEFFNELSLGGVDLFQANGCSAKSSLLVPKILRGFIKSGIFSVWRPTSSDAIRKMITGVSVLLSMIS